MRLHAVRALLPEDRPFRSSLLGRRSLGRTLDEPLGGIDAQLGSLEGRGHVALAAHPGANLVFLHLAEELLYVCESRLIAFDDSIRYESGRLARGAAVNIPMVQLSGRGQVLLERRGPVRSIKVEAERLITVDAERVLGWTGRLLPRPSMPEEVPSGSTNYVAFGGDGSLFLELPE